MTKESLRAPGEEEERYRNKRQVKFKFRLTIGSLRIAKNISLCHIVYSGHMDIEIHARLLCCRYYILLLTGTWKTFEYRRADMQGALVRVLDSHERIVYEVMPGGAETTTVQYSSI